MKAGRVNRTQTTAALVALVATLVPGCTSSAPTVAPDRPSVLPSTSPAVTTTTMPPGPVLGRAAAPGRALSLTSTRGQTYSYRGDPHRVTVAAPGGDVDENVREVFWPTGTPYRIDHDVCMTWHDPATSVEENYPQPGLALRVSPTGPDGNHVRAVTITQNVYGRSIWFAWLNVWDTTLGTKPTAVAAFDLFPIVSITRQTMRTPWRVCARIRGDRVDFKVWTDDAEPAWSDRTHVFHATLPPDWVEPGYAGGYIGHLHAGGTGTFSDIDVD